MTRTGAEEVFAALADPTRRRLVDWMATGATGTATEFAARLPISRQAVARHLGELESAGLVTATRRGKELRYALDPGPIEEAIDWLSSRVRAWESRLDALARYLDGEDAGTG